MSRFPKPKAFQSEPANADDGWIWGNNRGGCGEPVRDRNGKVVTNLKLANAQGSQGPHPRSSYDDSNNYYDRDRERGRDFDRDRNYNSPPSDRAYGRGNSNYPSDSYNRGTSCDSGSSQPYYNQNTHQYYSPDHAGSPKRFSALREMTSSLSPQQKNQKVSKEMEYREQLRLQIEENNRKKEQEKQRIEAEKRREYEMYHINGERRTSLPHQAYEREREPPRDYPRDHAPHRDFEQPRLREHEREQWKHEGGRDGYVSEGRRSNDNFSTPPRGGRAIPGLENHQYHKNKNDVNENPGSFRSPSLERDMIRNDDKYYHQEGHVYEDVGSHHGSRHSGGRDDGRFVSQSEYDELNSLCNRLMSQQERLEEEIRQQSEIIKSLQSNSNITNGRSRSAVQQGRQPVDARSKSVTKARPSSTNTKKPIDSSVANPPVTGLRSRNMVDAGKKIQENRKNIRVAFGASVIKEDNSKREPLGKNNSPLPASKQRGGPSGPAERGGQGNGFNKLLSGNRGPVVVTYEDENAMEPTRQPIGMIELKNASQFIPIKDKKIKKK